MDIEKDTWNAVIPSYFRDNNDCLVKHHIDSFNDFIINKIPQIFKSFHKRQFFRTDFNNDKLYYETTVYFGGKDGKGVYLAKPTVLDPSTGLTKQLFPNEARLKDLTYGSDIFYDVDIEFAMKERSDRADKPDKVIFEGVKIPTANFLKKIYLCKIPIMLRSCLCALQNASPELMYQMGESKWETGGYFIIDGSEKVIISEERRAENKIFYVKSSNHNLISKVCEVKSSSLSDFKPARTIKVQLEHKKTLTVRLGQDKPFLEPTENGRDVPLFVMFRLLGIESDKDIINCICGSSSGSSDSSDSGSDLVQNMMNLLEESAIDPIIVQNEIYDQQQAISYLDKLTRKVALEADKEQVMLNSEKRISHLLDTIYDTFFPHVGDDFTMKAYYLGYVVNQFLRHVMGLEQLTDRDNLVNKRIDLSGFMLSASFRNALREMVRRVDINISTKYELAHSEYSNENFINIINEGNFSEIFDSNKFQQHFINAIKKGNIDLSLGSKSGIVQAMERRSYYNDLAHLRRLRDTITGKISIERRRLHLSHYGYISPLETPEGGAKIGLLKHFAIMTTVAFGCPPDDLIELIKRYGLILLNEIMYKEISDMTKVFVNGVWIGMHRRPDQLSILIKLYRRNGLINIFTGISWNRLKAEIHFNTDQGRLLRPCYIVEDNELLIQPYMIKGLISGEYKWQDLLIGFNKRRGNSELKLRSDNFNYFDCSVKDLSTIGLGNVHVVSDIADVKYDNDIVIDELINKLRETQGVIEYLDVDEFNDTLFSSTLKIPKTMDDYIKIAKSLGNGENGDNYNQLVPKYTHTDLAPSINIGVTEWLLPYFHHNQGARGTYASLHTRQGIGIYTGNFNNRIDTSGHFLHYLERPICMSRMNVHINNHKMGTGQNVIAAITAYDGYNVEDAITFNKSSLDRGLFTTTLFKRYKDFEKVDDKLGSEEMFYNPNYPHLSPDPNVPTTILKKKLNYGKLDKYGFIREGSVLEEGDVMIGKYYKGKDEKGAIVYKDMSTVINKDYIGAVIDKVFTCYTNMNMYRMVKIRICQTRFPIIGDKFASRNGQKGTMGMAIPEENIPYTSDGIRPDIILNPYGYSGRMTLGQFYEMMFNEYAVKQGFFNVSSPYEVVNPEKIGDLLEDMGLNRYGDVMLYNGVTGEQMPATIFTGPIYYQRLKHMVQDKINARSGAERRNGLVVPGGGYDAKTRQTVAGRAHGGGLRIGEMERDAILAHGISKFVRESMMERSDKFPIYVSNKDGTVSFVNPDRGIAGIGTGGSGGIFMNPSIDGPVTYDISEGFDLGDTDGDSRSMNKYKEILGLNQENTTDNEFSKVEIPYSMKLLMDELCGMMIDVKVLPKINKVSNDMGMMLQSGGGDSDGSDSEEEELETIPEEEEMSPREQEEETDEENPDDPTENLKQEEEETDEPEEEEQSGGNSMGFNKIDLDELSGGGDVVNDLGFNKVDLDELSGGELLLEPIKLDGGGLDEDDEEPTTPIATMEDINHALTGGASPLFTDMLIKKQPKKKMSQQMENISNMIHSGPPQLQGDTGTQMDTVQTGGENDPTIKVIKLVNREPEQGGSGGKYLSSDMPSDFNELPN